MKRYSSFFLCLFFISSVALFSQQNDKKEDNRNLLESVGTLSSSNLYLSYLSLTLLKNDIDRNVNLENYKEIISPIETTLELVTKQLYKIRQIPDLSHDDALIIAKIEKACKLMKEDTELLIEYVNSKSDESNAKFDKKHKETGEFLQNLFSVNKDSIEKDKDE